MPSLRRASHNLSHYRLATMDMGWLVPVSCVEVLMGDTFVHSSSALLRVAPLLSPLMHPVDVRIHHWFVPFRVIWSDWDEFITGKSTPTFPTITYTTATDDYKLADALGLPDVTNTVSALPFRAYQLIYNEMYRDDDLITEVSLDTLDMRRIAWEKDYFTSCRPSAQQGSAFSIPFSSGSVPVTGIGIEDGSSTAGASKQLWETDAAAARTITAAWEDAGSNIMIEGESTSTAAGASNTPQIRADLSQASGGIDVNDLRLAIAQQKHAEARNRWGDRIQDYLAYHGIRPRDGRLDLPEYLGGGKQTISFSEVLATGSESGSTNLGDLAGHGIAALRTRRYGRFFAESGIVMSLMSIRPRAIYTEQIHRFWLRSDKDEFWQKEYEELGPQAVLKKEVYGAHGNSTDVFGYNGRHDDYRHHPSYVSGEFRDSTHYDWHMGRILGSSPTLNQSFVECSPTDRIYANASEAEVKVMINHDIRAKRMVRKTARF